MSTYNRNEPQKSKAKLYLVIGIILGIIVAALLIWNSGIFQKNAVAATVGDQEFTIPQLSYYYNAQISNKRQEAQMYQQFGMTPDYNTDLAPEEQYYNEAEGVTYADYFLDQALNALKEDTILCTEAKNAGYTLSSAGEASIAENLDALHMYSTQSGYSESAYLKLLYGQYMTKSLFKEMLANSILANEYAQAKQAEFTYSDDELNTYYDEHKADLDTYEYRYCYISNQPETATDEDGNAVEPTEEETAAAQAAAQANAEAMVAAVQGGTPFNEAAQAAQDEESAENFKDEEYNHVTDLLGQNIDNTYKAWLQDEARTVGEVTSLETSAGYCVVQFLGREKSEDTYQTINYRNILVLSETTDTEVPVTDASAVTDGTADEAASTETETVSKPEHSSKARALIKDTLSGITMFFNFSHPKKVKGLIMVTRSDKVTSERLVHSAKALPAILATLLGMMTDFRLLQPPKALEPMEVTPFGISMLFSDLHQEKQESGISVSLSESVTDSRSVQLSKT